MRFYYITLEEIGKYTNTNNLYFKFETNYKYRLVNKFLLHECRNGRKMLKIKIKLNQFCVLTFLF